MIKTALMEDMLASIKRLNEELDSRCQFEEKLLKYVDDSNTQLENYRKNIHDANAQLDKYRENWESCKINCRKLEEFINKTFLKEGQQVVFNVETQEYELVENP